MSLLRAVLEVEGKFAPTAQSLKLLSTNAGHPAFRNFMSLPAQDFMDIYYDSLSEPGSKPSVRGYESGVLFKQDIWLRARISYRECNDKPRTSWQAKIRRGGTYTNSAFEEVEGSQAVQHVVQQFISDVKIPMESVLDKMKLDKDIVGGARSTASSSILGLDTVARFVTHRQRWRLDNDFEVCVDETDFGHVVGEVELVQELEHHNQKELEIQREEAKGRLEANIQNFLDKYAWAFPKQEAVGKLASYFALRC